MRDAWYFALPSRLIKPGAMRTKTILGEPILFGRDRQGEAFALLDVCPHRGIPLSFGRFDGNEVECCYHGWRFAPNGRCTAIPSLIDGQGLDPTRIKVQRYPVREVQGNIWVYCGADPEGAAEIPVVPDVGGRSADLAETMELPCALDHAVVGLMDPAHGPFVHRAWWWRSAGSIHEKAKDFAPSPWGFTMLRHAPSSNSRAYRLIGGKPETEIAFRLPGVRIEHIRTGRLVLGALTAVTPTKEGVTEVNHCIWWTARWLDFVKPLARPYVRAFLRQDRDIMAKQAVGLRHAKALMLIDDADTQAKWYYRLKKEYAASRAEGRAFVNPVKARMLRWRS